MTTHLGRLMPHLGARYRYLDAHDLEKVLQHLDRLIGRDDPYARRRRAGGEIVSHGQKLVADMERALRRHAQKCLHHLYADRLVPNIDPHVAAAWPPWTHSNVPT